MIHQSRPLAVRYTQDMVPRITTDRLLLRECRVDEFEDFATHMADPVAQKYTSGGMDRRQAWRAFTSMMGQWMLTDAGWWAVEVRTTGKIVGHVGAFIRETTPGLELGWSFYRSGWGHGYAREAASAARDFAFTSRAARRLIAHIDDGNTASVRVSEALGMRYEQDVDFYGKPIGRYAVER